MLSRTVKIFLPRCHLDLWIPHSRQNTIIFPAGNVCLTSRNTRLLPLTAPSVVHLMNCLPPALSSPALCRRIFHFYLHLNGFKILNYGVIKSQNIFNVKKFLKNFSTVRAHHKALTLISVCGRRYADRLFKNCAEITGIVITAGLTDLGNRHPALS